MANESEYIEIGSGTLGPNANKKRPSQPDITGSITLQGEKIFISAWKRYKSEDRTFYTFSLTKRKSVEEIQQEFAPDPEDQDDNLDPF